MRSHINGVNESERCKQLRRRLLNIIGSATYKSWFSQTKLVEDPKTGYIKWVCECPWFDGQLVKRFGATMVNLNKEVAPAKAPEPKKVEPKEDDAIFGYPKGHSKYLS